MKSKLPLLIGLSAVLLATSCSANCPQQAKNPALRRSQFLQLASRRKGINQGINHPPHHRHHHLPRHLSHWHPSARKTSFPRWPSRRRTRTDRPRSSTIHPSRSPILGPWHRCPTPKNLPQPIKRATYAWLPGRKAETVTAVQLLTVPKLNATLPLRYRRTA